MPLLLAYGTMGIEMAIAPLWVERQMEDDSVIKSKVYFTQGGKYESYAASIRMGQTKTADKK